MNIFSVGCGITYIFLESRSGGKALLVDLRQCLGLCLTAHYSLDRLYYGDHQTLPRAT